MTTPKYVSIATAAAMLELSPRTIRRRISSGELRGKHAGKGTRAPVRVAEEDVLAMLRDIPTA